MELSTPLPSVDPNGPLSLIHELRNLIGENRADLSREHQLISRFRQEKITNNDYKGRQLLELIQNADDAGSDYIRIELDTKKARLSVINGGTPFSFKGFRSIMIPNLSPKQKKIFIGNKGLGFRSILNWSRQVTIISAGIELTFSKELAKKAFYSLYRAEEKRRKILEEFDLPHYAVPFPIFAIPEAIETELVPNHTSIIIEYIQEEEADIKTQLQMLREEVLLFLNHIRKIELHIDEKITMFTSQLKEEEKITIGNRTWQVFSNKQEGVDPTLPEKYRDPDIEDEEAYSFRIAVQNDLSDNVNRLFSFFPTKIKLCLPIVVHGTFELDSSRNRIIDSAKNRFLMKELLQLLYKVSGHLKNTNTAAGWDALRMLNYQSQKDPVLEEFGFYQAIDEKIRQGRILPCLDGTYRNYGSVNHYSNHFAEMIQELKLTTFFPELLLPVPKDLNTYFRTLFNPSSPYKEYASAVLKSKAEVASTGLWNAGTVTPDQYAQWIAGLGDIIPVDVKERYALIYRNLDTTERDRELIKSSFTIFTPATKKSNIHLPEHIRISYINQVLYEALLRQYRLTDEQDPSRKLKDKLEHFINLQSFEPAPVLTQIITGTNRAIEAMDKTEEKRKLVRAMMRSLFSYYQSSDRANQAQIRTNRISVITQTGRIHFANDCFLSTDYPAGALRQELLGNLYLPDQLLATAEELSLEGDSAEIQRFLTEFLGVNSYVQLVRLEDRINKDDPYTDFLFAHQPRPAGFRDYRISYTSISNPDVIVQHLRNRSISLENLIAWMHLDPFIREKLPNNPGQNQDTIFYYNQDNRSHSTFPHRIESIPSYICYQLTTITNLKHYVLEDAGIPFLNEKNIDCKHDIFTRHDIDAGTVRGILQRLGAKNDFGELDIERISSIVHMLPEKDPQGRQARKIYQLCTDRYKEMKEVLIKKPDLLLHATHGAEKGYVAYRQVYYANNWSLPRKLLQVQPVLNFPKRSGEQNVAAFFAVQTLDNLSFHAAGYKKNEELTGILDAYLDQIKPYILSLRLSKVRSNEDIDAAVRTTRALSIAMCTELFYKYNGETHEADQYDFVPINEGSNAFLVKYNGSATLDALKKDSGLSDAIMEIITITFDVVNIQMEVRSIFRNDLEDTRHQFIKNYGEEALQSALARLQISEKNRNAWRIIYQLKQIPDAIPPIQAEKDFIKQIADALGIETCKIAKVDFGALYTADQQKHLHELFMALQMPLEIFNRESGLNITLEKYHREQFRQALDTLKQLFTYSLWKFYSVQEPSQRKYFKKQLRDLELLIPQLTTELGTQHQQLLLQRFNEESGLSITDTDTYNDDYLDQIRKNKKALACSGEILDRLDENLSSLLYFPLSPDELSAIKSRLVQMEDASRAPIVDTPDLNEEPDASNTKDIEPLPPSNNRGNKGRGKTAGGNGPGRTPGSGNTGTPQDVKDKLGKKAERDVLESLKEKYGPLNVTWLSSYSNHPAKDNNLGYDIRFRENETAAWQYAEVKWFGSGHFYLSGPELNFAKENKDRYTLFLVKEESIQAVPITALLDENNELNECNDFFSIKITEYEFTWLG